MSTYQIISNISNRFPGLIHNNKPLDLCNDLSVPLQYRSAVLSPVLHHTSQEGRR